MAFKQVLLAVQYPTARTNRTGHREEVMRWTIKQGNILDEPADVLVCSANVFLNLSGGVGGELLLRYGPEMQQQLHRYLTDRRLHFVQQCDVVPCGPCGTPYKAVLHAVA